jgi:hypothetical protein
MVRAILDGKKTQTRRVVTPQPPESIDALHGRDLRGRAPYELTDSEGFRLTGFGFQDDSERLYRAPGQVGDRLWVREAFECLDGNGHEKCILYLADGEQRYVEDTRPAASVLPMAERKHPSIHMPRWASRIALEITDVRVQRVQEISEEDAKAEGINPIYVDTYGDERDARYIDGPGGFAYLWDSINAKRKGGQYAWEKNPWVWAITFRRLEDGDAEG